jgi:hypothetical protein
MLIVTVKIKARKKLRKYNRVQYDNMSRSGSSKKYPSVCNVMYGTDTII